MAVTMKSVGYLFLLSSQRRLLECIWLIVATEDVGSWMAVEMGNELRLLDLVGRWLQRRILSFIRWSF